MADSKITMIIPTMNRPELVNFALRYYSDFPGRIIVADGSPEPCPPWPMPRNCAYIHEPLFWQRRNRRAVEMVDTPYVVFRADRRCMTNLAWREGIRFLDENPDYAAVDGNQIDLIPNDSKGYEFRMAYPWDFLGEAEYSDDPAMRLSQIFYPTYKHLAIWGVTRSEVWRDTVESYQDLMPSAFLYEVYQIMIMAAHGKFAVLPIAFSTIFANYHNASHYHNPVYRQPLSEYFSGEQEESFCATIVPKIQQITGMNLQKCKDAVRNSIDTLVRHTIMKRPPLRSSLEKHLRNLDENSLAAYHELGRAYALEIVGDKKLKIAFGGVWKQHSMKLFEMIADAWKAAETEYILIQDYSYAMDWKAPEAGIFDRITKLSQRLDENGLEKAEVEKELMELLEKSKPDFFCLLSDWLPAYDIIKKTCKELQIPIIVIQNGFPGSEELPADFFAAWDDEWARKFKLKSGCKIWACGSLDFTRIVRGKDLDKKSSPTAYGKNEKIICVFLPETDKGIRSFMESLERCASLFPDNCRFIIPVPPKGKDLEFDLVLSRNNISFLPVQIDEDFLLQYADMAIGEYSSSMLRALMAGIPSLIVSERDKFPADSNLANYAHSEELDAALKELAVKLEKKALNRENPDSEKTAPLVFHQLVMATREPLTELREKLYATGMIKFKDETLIKDEEEASA